jgi:Ca-activated chloride channel family protein
MTSRASLLPRAWALLACLLAVAAGLSACSSRHEGAADSQAGPADLRILAGSEVRPLEPDIVRAAAAAGLTVKLEYSGTLDMVDRINAGEPFDAILPPSGAYPQLALTVKPVAREKLFFSRVAIGVKQSKAHALGWDQQIPSWREITQAVRAGQLSYAMTNPTSSNSGMSALFAVAASLAGKTEELSAADVDRQGLVDFLRGQKLTAGSSEWLADAYLRDPRHLDAIVNYEAVLLRLNDRLAGEKLSVVYPREGVISADYPLMLLAPGKQAQYDRLVAALKAPAFQAGPVARSYLRPVDPTVPRSPALSGALVIDLAFPNNLQVIDSVLSAYQAELRRPATSIYVLDVSGSMEGERIAGLKAALAILTGLDTQDAHGRYLRFQHRERVVLIPFSGEVGTPARFSFENEEQQAATRQALLSYVHGLTAGGSTSIYSALAIAYGIAQEEARGDAGRLVTIVLLTDGESNTGISPEEFQARLARLAADGSLPARTFPILFGEGSARQLEGIARLTGGRTFDGLRGDLTGVLKEIRGYQ